jgi:hypothetical protein
VLHSIVAGIAFAGGGAERIVTKAIAVEFETFRFDAFATVWICFGGGKAEWGDEGRGGCGGCFGGCWESDLDGIDIFKCFRDGCGFGKIGQTFFLVRSWICGFVFGFHGLVYDDRIGEFSFIHLGASVEQLSAATGNFIL